jgi:hypothetical protein
MMPDAWSDKDERQYEGIRREQRERGKSEDEAKEVAARTVNEQRRKEGRTANRTTSGEGNPNTRLENRSKKQLVQRAGTLEIDGRSQMSKDELIRAIRRRQ